MASTSGGKAEAKPEVMASVLATLRASKEALSQEELESRTMFSGKDLGQAMNSLLQEGRISLLATDDGQIAFQLAGELQVQKQEKLKGLTRDELLIYQLIQGVGDTGIWTKDLKIRSNLAQTRLPKILKALEGRNLIKAVKGVNVGNRKIYMLFELKPSEDLTGGTWYTENHLDEDFVESIRTVCRQYIGRQGSVTLDDISNFISEKGFSTVALTEQDVLKIVTTLVYDGEVDEITGSDDVQLYIPTSSRMPESTPFSKIPCGHCPVMHECTDGNDISPSTCVYYNEWLNF